MNAYEDDTEMLAAQVREEVRVTPAVALDPVVAAVLAEFRRSVPGLDQAVLGEALMRAASAAWRVSLGRDVAFQTAQSMALAFAATGLRLHEAAAEEAH
ncbi:hypothetical protein [Streptacidiphilus sp. EB103A]|uniref:hypothetical protein n=1 Tax=Streptacidiphilus sp. EB103A TaxID=3156275 RepID=UPI0035130377